MVRLVFPTPQRAQPCSTVIKSTSTSLLALDILETCVPVPARRSYCYAIAHFGFVTIVCFGTLGCANFHTSLLHVRPEHWLQLTNRARNVGGARLKFNTALAHTTRTKTRATCPPQTSSAVHARRGSADRRVASAPMSVLAGGSCRAYSNGKAVPDALRASIAWA